MSGIGTPRRNRGERNAARQAACRSAPVYPVVS